MSTTETAASSSQHVLALALRELPLRSLSASFAVSHLWHAAAEEAQASLSVLDLRALSESLTDDVLESVLARTPMLHTLNVSSCTKLTDDGLAAVARRCPLLSDLNCACLPKITADGVSQVVDARGPRLDSLELGGCVAITPSELVRRFARFLELDDDEDGLDKVQG